MDENSRTGNLTPSKENYLKVILGLSGDERARPVDIANALGVSKASVSNMMNVLMDEGYVTKEKYGVIALTESGKDAAVSVKDRYELLRRFLHTVLGVDAETAAKDACRMEHIISSETADRIDRQLEERADPAQEKKRVSNGERMGKKHEGG